MNSMYLPTYIHPNVLLSISDAAVMMAVTRGTSGKTVFVKNLDTVLATTKLKRGEVVVKIKTKVSKP